MLPGHARDGGHARAGPQGTEVLARGLRAGGVAALRRGRVALVPAVGRQHGVRRDLEQLRRGGARFF